MTDTWLVHILDNSQKILGKFDLTDDPSAPNTFSNWKLSGFLHYLKQTPAPAPYLLSGGAVEADVFKNNQLYGIISFGAPEHVTAGQIENRPVILHVDHVQNVTNLRNAKPGDPPLQFKQVPRMNLNAVCVHAG